MRIASIVLLLAGCGPMLVGGAPVAEGLRADGDELVGDGRWEGPTRAGALYNAVIEIPAGTRAKYELDHARDRMVWSERNGERRVIAGLGYPANYGFVPGTMAARDEGGDGDPIDVLVLGDVLPRGAVVAVRILGALALIDDGEADDKLIAVVPSASGIGAAEGLDSLEHAAPGTLHAIEHFFLHYDPAETAESHGYRDRNQAEAMLH